MALPAGTPMYGGIQYKQQKDFYIHVCFSRGIDDVYKFWSIIGDRHPLHPEWGNVRLEGKKHLHGSMYRMRHEWRHATTEKRRIMVEEVVKQYGELPAVDVHEFTKDEKREINKQRSIEMRGLVHELPGQGGDDHRRIQVVLKAILSINGHCRVDIGGKIKGLGAPDVISYRKENSSGPWYFVEVELNHTEAAALSKLRKAVETYNSRPVIILPKSRMHVIDPDAEPWQKELIIITSEKVLSCIEKIQQFDFDGLVEIGRLLGLYK